nr:hypothetical protein Itr_chr14CG07980 [Ipomoea trifida]
MVFDPIVFKFSFLHHTIAARHSFPSSSHHPPQPPLPPYCVWDRICRSPPVSTARRMPLPGVAAGRYPPSLPVSTAGRCSSSHAGLLSLVRCHIFVNILLR